MTAHWTDYYAQVARQGCDTLDFSTARQQMETWFAALKLAGEVQGRRVLDVGCGRGQFTALLHTLGADLAYGVDATPELVFDARQRWPGCDFDVLELDDLRYLKPGRFDLVTCLEVLHVAERASDAVVDLWRLVAPGGRMVVALWNLDSPFQDVELWHPPDAPWSGLDEAAINPTLRRMAGLVSWRVQGLHVADDQRVEVFDSRRNFDPMPLSWLVVGVKS